MMTCPERIPSSSVKNCDVSYERPITTGKIARFFRWIAGSTLYEAWSGGPPAKAEMEKATHAQTIAAFKPVNFQFHICRLEKYPNDCSESDLLSMRRLLGEL